MPVNLAYVKFVNDRVRAVVNAEDFDDFLPRHSTDFKRDKNYLVDWKTESGGVEKCPAKILCLAVSREDLISSVNENKLPKLPPSFVGGGGLITEKSLALPSSNQISDKEELLAASTSRRSRSKKALEIATKALSHKHTDSKDTDEMENMKENSRKKPEGSSVVADNAEDVPVLRSGGARKSKSKAKLNLLDSGLLDESYSDEDDSLIPRKELTFLEDESARLKKQLQNALEKLQTAEEQLLSKEDELMKLREQLNVIQVKFEASEARNSKWQDIFISRSLDNPLTEHPIPFAKASGSRDSAIHKGNRSPKGSVKKTPRLFGGSSGGEMDFLGTGIEQDFSSDGTGMLSHCESSGLSPSPLSVHKNNATKSSSPTYKLDIITPEKKKRTPLKVGLQSPVNGKRFSGNRTPSKNRDYTLEDEETPSKADKRNLQNKNTPLKNVETSPQGTSTPAKSGKRKSPFKSDGGNSKKRLKTWSIDTAKILQYAEKALPDFQQKHPTLVQDEKVTLGPVTFSEDQWNLIRHSKCDSKLVSNTLRAIWTRSELGRRSLKGFVSNRKKVSEPKPPLEREKVFVVYGLFRAYLMKDGVKEPRLSEMVSNKGTSLITNRLAEEDRWLAKQADSP